MVQDALYDVVVVASPESAAWESGRAFGALVVDPLLEKDVDVIGPLQPAATAAPGEAIPRWAVYDCAEVPGAVIARLSRPVASAFGAPLAPEAIVLATPHAERGAWHLYGFAVERPEAERDAARFEMIRLAMSVLDATSVTLIEPLESQLVTRLPELGAVTTLATDTPERGGRSAATLRITRREPVVRARAAVAAPSRLALARRGPAALLDRLEPFVVAPSWRFASLELSPFGVSIPDENCIDVLGSRARELLDRLVRLDRLTFGEEGMPMPEWLFVDASALPGVICGLGLRAREIPAKDLARLDLSASLDDLVPLAMFIAVPVRPPKVWFGHNLASLNRLLPDLGLRGLAGVCKALGLVVMRAEEQLGATQWASEALHVHSRFGPLELLSTWTPAHADPATLTYRLRVTAEGLARATSGARAPRQFAGAFLVEAEDHATFRELERRTERGERFAIVGPPETDGAGVKRVPVAPLNA
ncbi:MAG: hypothetical protein U0271_48235 [Polyangiaceae bacterium]